MRDLNLRPLILNYILLVELSSCKQFLVNFNRGKYSILENKTNENQLNYNSFKSFKLFNRKLTQNEQKK